MGWQLLVVDSGHIAAWLDDGRLIDAERGILSRKDVAEYAAGRAVRAARKPDAVAYVVVAVVVVVAAPRWRCAESLRCSAL